MAFQTKQPSGWQNGPAGGTPLNATGLNDLETRIQTAINAAAGVLPVNVSDYQGAGVTDTAAALAAADAACTQGRGLYFPRRATEWVLTQEIPITAGIEVFSDWAVIRQSTWRKPVFDLLTTNDVDVHHFYLRSTATRTNGTGSVRGDDEDRYGAGVWGAGSRCKARYLRVEGLDSAAHFTNWTTGTTHTGTPSGNRVEHIEVANVDFGVLFISQAHGHIDDIAGSYIRSTGSGDPAHLIYVIGNVTDPCRDLTGGNWRAKDSTADPAFQIRYTNGGALGALYARNCGGLLMYEALTDFAIDRLIGVDDQKADEVGSIAAIGGGTDPSARVKVKTAIVRKAVSGRAVLWSGTDCEIGDLTVVANRTADNSNGDIELDGTRNRISTLRHRNAGSSTTGAEAVRIRGTSVDCELLDPEIRNDATTPSCQNGIVVVASATRANVRFDPAMIVPKAGSSKLADSGTGTVRGAYEPAFSTYKPIIDRGARVDASVIAARILLPDASTTSSAADAGRGLFYFDPANHAAGGHTTKLRISGMVATNNVAPTSDFRFGLYPITAVAGGSAAVTVTLGSVVSGSEATITAPAANSLNHVYATDVTAPAAGYYVLVCTVLTNNMAANSAAIVRAVLDYRQV